MGIEPSPADIKFQLTGSWSAAAWPCVIAQQYYSPARISFLFHSHKEKFCAPVKNEILDFEQYLLQLRKSETA